MTPAPNEKSQCECCRKELNTPIVKVGLLCTNCLRYIVKKNREALPRVAREIFEKIENLRRWQNGTFVMYGDIKDLKKEYGVE